MKTRQIVILCSLALLACGATWFAACAGNARSSQRVAIGLGGMANAPVPASPSTTPSNSTTTYNDYSRSYDLDLGKGLAAAGQGAASTPPSSKPEGGVLWSKFGIDQEKGSTDYNNDGLTLDLEPNLNQPSAAFDPAPRPVNPTNTPAPTTTTTPPSVPMLGDIPLLTGNRFVARDSRRVISTTPAPSWAKDALSAANTEVWIITKPPAPPAPDDDTPGTGTLYTTLPVELDPQQKQVAVPLEHTDVKASIVGHLSGVEVTQTFHNPYSSKIEAVYAFPLPENAAVSEFVMTIGDRHIRGIIRDRAEAEQIYTEARNQGYVASLLTQERANIFTQKVANIEPGKSIDVAVTYFGPLTYSDGAFEFVFPMVVGPRFNPPGTSDGVGAVGRGNAGASGQSTEVQYLRPNERSGHDISLTVDIDAGLPIARVESVNHAVETRLQGVTGAHVTLSRNDSVPNKDFVLRVHVAGDRLQSALLTQADERDPTTGYFNLLLVPPASLKSVPRGPVEMVFVLDCSGSMNGRPIEQAKEAIERGLARMQPGDTFQLINFSNNASQLGARTLDASPQNIRAAREYLARLQSEGGTYMVEGIKAALGFPSDDLRPRYVAFLTDGFIGNEDDVLRNLYAGLGASRVFSFGVGSGPNRALMDSMARMGRGAAAYLSFNDSSGEVMDQYFDRISHPAMTHVTIQTGTSEGESSVCDVFPCRIPDVFVGRPVVVVGRYKGSAPTSLTVKGRCGGQEVSMIAQAVRAETALARKAIPKVWARAKLTELAEAAVVSDRPVLAAETRQTALDYSLMSAFTAFVAVDSSQRTAGTFGTTVNVPVPVPEGTRYGTTVQEK